MKFIVPAAVIVLLVGLIGVFGFVFFNKRLEQSKANKNASTIAPSTQSGTVTETGSKPSSVVQKNLGAVESSISLQILSPSDGASVTTPTITLRGKTVSQAEVFVNDKELRADGNGNFSTSLLLEDGDNPIIVVANDSSGKVAEAELTVTYEPAQ